MVTRGQYLERPTVIPVGERVLEGLWHRGKEPLSLLVVPPLPDDGGMDHVAAAELAFQAASAGFPSLRFNFRGVGASQGPRDATKVLEDARAALELARENHTGQVAIAGVGSGCTVAAKLSLEAAVAGCLLVAPAQIDVWPAKVWVVVASLEPRLAGLDEAVRAAGGRCEDVETDRTFHRQLPQVGRIAVGWLTEAARAGKH